MQAVLLVTSLTLAAMTGYLLHTRGVLQARLDNDEARLREQGESIARLDDALTETKMSLKQATMDLQDQQMRMAQQAADMVDLRKSMTVLARTPQHKVAFTARLASHITKMGYQQTIIFDTVVTNIHNCYSSDTGIFTANTNGTFFFFASIMTHNDAMLESEIVKNGDTVVLMYNYAPSQPDQSVNGVILVLAEGDRVWVRVRQYSGNRKYGGSWRWSSFSGFQIQ